MLKIKLLSEGILNEEVIGAQALVYHGSRTEPNEMLDLIKNNKFDPGQVGGAMYGPGLYTVYNLPETNTDKGKYGDFVYKFKVNMYGFIIFDREIAQKVYGKPLQPQEQAKLLGYDFLLHILKDLNTRSDGRITSERALTLANSLTSRKVKIKGIVFTGRNDGPVAIIYDYTSAIIIGYKNVKADKIWKKFDAADIKDQIKTTLHKPLYTIAKIGDSGRKSMLAKTEIHEEDIELEPDDLKILNRKAIFNKKLKLLGMTYDHIEKYLKHIQIRESLTLVGYESDTFPNIFDLSKSHLIIDFSDRLRELPNNLIVGKSLTIHGEIPRLKSLPNGLVIGGKLNWNVIDNDLPELPQDIKVHGNGFIEQYIHFIEPRELWVKYIDMLKMYRSDDYEKLLRDFKIAKAKIDDDNIRTRGWA